MIATTTVPAIYALSGLGFSIMYVGVYLIVIFVTLAGITYPLLAFSKKIKSIIFSHHD